MYQSTGKEILRTSQDMPSPGTAGEQVFISNSRQAVLGYQISLAGQDWQPEEESHNLGGAGDAFAILKIDSPTFNVWTPYCQEGLGKHPLASMGLRWFDVFEVKESIFSQDGAYLQRKHWIFQFEDSTLDIVCSDIKVHLFKGSVEGMQKKVCEIHAARA